MSLHRTNADRADDVRPFVEALMEEWNTDHLEQTIQDIISNLGHLHDQLGDDERDLDGDGQPCCTYEELVQSGLGNYLEEVEEEDE